MGWGKISNIIVWCSSTISGIINNLIFTKFTTTIHGVSSLWNHINIAPYNHLILSSQVLLVRILFKVHISFRTSSIQWSRLVNKGRRRGNVIPLTVILLLGCQRCPSDSQVNNRYHCNNNI